MVARVLAMGAAIHKLAKQLVTIDETLAGHAIWRTDRLSGLFGERQVHGAVLAAKEASCSEGFELFYGEYSLFAIEIIHYWDIVICSSQQELLVPNKLLRPNSIFVGLNLDLNDHCHENNKNQMDD